MNQLRHRVRWLKQCLVRPDVGIVGGYHHGNLGDMALGYTVEEALRPRRVTTGLQTIYNMDRWPHTYKAIVGGGAVGYASPLTLLATRYHKTPSQVGFLGVDFNDPKAISNTKDFLKAVRFISCRSISQATALQTQLERSDITSHPDIAFAYEADRCAFHRKNWSPKDKLRFGINLVPLYAEADGREWIPSESLRNERPRLIREFRTLHERYVTFARAICRDHISMGYKVIHFPFTPDDDTYAQNALDGIDVAFRPYNSSPNAVLTDLTRITRIFTTRFHALVFAAKLGIEVIPFAYATKKERLLETLQYSRGQVLNPELLLDGSASTISWERLIERFPDSLVSHIEEDTRLALTTLLAHIV